MPSRPGQGGRRSDCKNMAKCGHRSMYYCRLYCDLWVGCKWLSYRARVARIRKQAAEHDWLETNRRRGLLIAREVKGTISEEEADELERLQHLADLRTDMLDPFDTEELQNHAN